MRTLARTSSLAFLLALAAPAAAQTTFHGVEPNDTKDEATYAGPMVDGDRLRTDEGCPPRQDPNIFRVQTADRPDGIYRHRLEPASPFLYDHFPRILGRTQWFGQVDAQSHAIVQQSNGATAPARFVQWYGFGQAEEVYVDLDDPNDCRTSFEVELDTVPVQPIVIPHTFVADRATTFSTAGSGNPTTADTELWMFDAEGNAVPELGNDDEEFFSTPQSSLTVRLPPGTFYLALADHELATHLPSVPGDGRHWGDVLDFAGAAVCGSPAAPIAFQLDVDAFQYSNSFQATKQEPFEVVWFRLDVGSGQAAQTYCYGDGSLASCAGGDAVAGTRSGCPNSTGRGATLLVHGSLRVFDARLHVEDVPPGTSVLGFVGRNTGAGAPALGGISCVGPGALRVGPFQADATGTARASAPLSTLGFQPGDTLYVQAAYRDAVAPTGQEVNLTQAVAFQVTQ